jgi:hypothetical protein
MHVRRYWPDFDPIALAVLVAVVVLTLLAAGSARAEVLRVGAALCHR